MIAVIIMLAWNFLFSVGIIFANKILYAKYGVPPVSLASAHFAATFVGLLVYWALGGFKIKQIPILKVLPISIAFCSFVVFTNFSLKYNSVGTYQMLKCLGDPLLIVLQSLMYGKKYTKGIMISLAIMVFGIILNSFYDVRFSALGIFFAVIAVVGSTFYFMWIGAKQEELGIGPLQLLVYQAPLSSFILVLVVFYIEPPWDAMGIVSAMNRCPVLILISMTMACGVNVTVFYIIKHTSVVTYAVFSKLKTCVVILAGSLLFAHNSQKPLQLFGIFLTLLGTSGYTAVKLWGSGKSTLKLVRSPSALPISIPSTKETLFKKSLGEELGIIHIVGRSPREARLSHL